MSEQVREVPAAGNPIARIVGVIFSPGKTFQEIAAAPSWLPPLLICLVITLAAFAIYGMKANWMGIMEDYITENPLMKLAPDEVMEKAVSEQQANIRGYSQWQLTLLNGLNIVGIIIATHVMTLIYLTLFYIMGSVADVRLGRAWLTFLLCLVALIVAGVINGVGGFVFQKDSPGTYLLLVTTCVLAMITTYTFLMNRNARRDPGFHRFLAAGSYAWAATGIVVAIALALTAFVTPAPIEVRGDYLVKSNLGAFMPSDNAALQSLLSSIDVFTIWFFIVLTIGYRTMAKTSTGLAASITFLPWAFWVLVKLAWAAAAPS